MKDKMETPRNDLFPNLWSVGKIKGDFVVQSYQQQESFDFRDEFNI